jgi:excisionase family DNA binding protein
MEAKIERKTLTVTEAAKALGVSRNKAYEAVRRGEIPTIKIGKRIQGKGKGSRYGKGLLSRAQGCRSCPTKRDNSLFRFGLEQAQHVDDFESLLDAMRTRNMYCQPPLADDVVVAKAMSAWRYEQEGRNLVGRGRAVDRSASAGVTGFVASAGGGRLRV